MWSARSCLASKRPCCRRTKSSTGKRKRAPRSTRRIEMNDNAERKGAEVREAQMGCPDGEIRTAFIVTPFPLGDARELTVFEGFDCLSRAAEYARARNRAAHFGL